MPKVSLLTFGIFVFTFIIALFLVNGTEIFKNISKQDGCEINKVVKTVRGESMYPLLKHGQEIVVSEGYYNCNSPQIGDLVMVDHANRETPLVKVIRAVPNNKLQIVKEDDFYKIIVNGQSLKNSVGKLYRLSEQEAKMISLYERDYKGMIPKDAYLILGDNVDSSLDSTEFGLVGKKSLLGKINYHP
ncbi:MAG: signal peptidase I [Candidatus Paceibacterota bacterium]